EGAAREVQETLEREASGQLSVMEKDTKGVWRKAIAKI
ncbi:MAG: hypothetical protein EZS28_017826, partial [Streblomastix strix]